MNRRSPTLLGDLLCALEVPHTSDYSDRRFRSMPFMSLFGLKKLLDEYGVDSDAFEVGDRKMPVGIPVPFVAGVGGRYVVVTSFGDDTVEYIDSGEVGSIPRQRFDRIFSGIVMLFSLRPEAREPGYRAHRDICIASKAKTYVMCLAFVALIAYFFIDREVYHFPAAIVVMLLDMCGLYVSVLLVRKQLGIKDKAADRVCAVLKAGGCDSIMSTDASKFFGLFGWSEVGLAYFGVSFATLLIFPSQWAHLALINGCCLPYSFWSIWYQRFRARTWCTLCVTVQLILWLEFFSYLLGGFWQKGVFDNFLSLAALSFAYLGSLLLINAVNSLKTQQSENNNGHGKD